ncbi:MAG: glycoside hydrolase family 88 protein [Prevotellaceae bacterium]|nr:glycoside hydrolase family 88 protein [Prevotellaceae bacterium]
MATLFFGCSSKPASWAEKMANSEMKRYPEAWQMDFNKKPRWNYCPGMEAYAIYLTYKATGSKQYLNYVKGFGDTLILADGTIRTYEMDKFNIDYVAGGKTLVALYKETGEDKYKKAIETLREQMRRQPRTSEGGFWHKQIYPHQMWLDGLYMASPFLALYAKEFNEPALFDEVAHQLILIARHTYNARTGLHYHGWDESMEQRWANKHTGTSPNFWSRSVGWYMMALVDVLEYLPEEHPRRPEILIILQNLSAAVEKYRDPKTGVWYQVTDQVGRDKNYLESSGTCMFMYTWAKGANNGWLDTSYHSKANKLFDNIVDQFIKTEANGTISITDGCAVAGLGGEKNYRDGSYEYYVSEPVRDNDPKSVATFLFGALELKR